MEHPFAAELRAARASGSVDALVRAIGERYGVPTLAPAVARYVGATLTAPPDGALRLLAIEDALARPTTCDRVFGRFGDAPFPALEIGGHRGSPFFLDLASGRVISLHHDATLYERAAECGGRTPAEAMAELVDVGSASDVDALVALSRRLREVFGTGKLAPRPLYARVVLDALGLDVAAARYLVETQPFEHLDLRVGDLDDLPPPGATAMPPKEPAKKTAAPHPRLDLLLPDAATLTEIDLSNTMLTNLPAEIEQFTRLERLDLSENPALDWDAAMAVLARMPSLREVSFLRSGLKELPRGLASVASLTALDLHGTPLWRGDNVLQNGPALSIAAKLPRLRKLRLAMNDRDGSAGAAIRSPALAGVEDLSLWLQGIADGIEPIVEAMPRLRSLELFGAYKTHLEPLARLPLETLRLDGIDTTSVASLPPTLRALHLTRADGLRVLDVSHLPALESLSVDGGRLESVVGLEKTRIRSLSVQFRGAGVLALRGLGALETLSVSSPSPLSLDLSELDALADLTLRCAGSITAPRAALRALSMWGMPPWVDAQASLESIVLGGRAGAEAVGRALALPRLRKLHMESWSAPVPDRFAGTLVSDVSLRSARIGAAALEAIARAPHLEKLVLPLDVTRLPEALAERPLRYVAYAQRRDGGPLDLAHAFRVLGSTGLTRLGLDGIQHLPDEIGSLSDLEALELAPGTAVTLPTTIAALEKLRSIRLGIRLTAPERKRILDLVPRASLREPPP